MLILCEWYLTKTAIIVHAYSILFFLMLYIMYIYTIEQKLYKHFFCTKYSFIALLFGYWYSLYYIGIWKTMAQPIWRRIISLFHFGHAWLKSIAKFIHYSDVTSASWRLKWPATLRSNLFRPRSEKTWKPRVAGSLWGESIDNWCILITKGQ